MVEHCLSQLIFDTKFEPKIESKALSPSSEVENSTEAFGKMSTSIYNVCLFCRTKPHTFRRQPMLSKPANHKTALLLHSVQSY